MDGALWNALCDVEVPERYAAIAARARADLAAAWGGLDPGTRAAASAHVAATPPGEPQEILRHMAALPSCFYDAAVAARGVAILTAVTGGCRRAGPVVAAAGAEKVWGGVPLRYQERDHRWYADAAQALAADLNQAPAAPRTQEG